MTITESPRASEKAGAELRLMREDDLLRFVWIADPQISPDGSRVAFTKVWVDAEADEYRTSVWIVETAGGPPRPLTSGERDSQPRWSPDGHTLAFVRSTAPKEPGQLYLLPMAGGEGTLLCRIEKGISEPVWSPDGRRIAFLSATNPALDDPKKEKPKNEPARVVTRPVFRENNEGFIDLDRMSQVWVVEVEGGKPHPLTRGRYAAASPRWSRDGRHVFFVSDRRPEPWFGYEESCVYAVPAGLSEPTDGDRLETVVGYPGLVTSYLELADGRMATIGFLNGERMLSYSLPRLLLTEGPWPRRAAVDLSAGCEDEIGGAINSDQHPPRGGGQTPLAASSDGRALLTSLARHGVSMLARIELSAGKLTTLTPPRYDLIAGTASADGRTWGLTLGEPTRPGDLYCFDAQTGTLRKLWGPNDELFAGLRLGEVEEFWHPSFDGRQIQAWIVKPPDFDPGRKYPLILEIHGGPHTAYGAGFFHEFHVLAAAGYVVLYTNPRGSTSYGHEFANVIQYRFPGDDARDLLASVDAVLERGYVDPARLGITGGSGGGLLTNWIIAQTDRFAAAVTQRCVTDWASLYYSSDFSMFAPFWFKRQPWEDPEEFRLRSPVAFAERITTPLMIIHSEEDWRTPIAQGETMFRALKQQRKRVVMVRFPGENHELSRSGVPSRRVQNQHHIRAWFDKWLMGTAAPEYDEA